MVDPQTSDLGRAWLSPEHAIEILGYLGFLPIRFELHGRRGLPYRGIELDDFYSELGGKVILQSSGTWGVLREHNPIFGSDRT